MASKRAWGCFETGYTERRRKQERTPAVTQKVVNSPLHCMGIQCFTVERLRADKRGGPERMDSLTELEHFLETMDMTKVEEEKIARIIERLRDELSAAS